MNFLVDMNLSPHWADFLNQAGHMAVHWSNVGAPTAGDVEVMNWAAEHDHVVLTADLDFPAILAANTRQRPSVILVRSDVLTTDALGSAVLAAIQQARAELTAGAIVSLKGAIADAPAPRAIKPAIMGPRNPRHQSALMFGAALACRFL